MNPQPTHHDEPRESANHSGVDLEGALDVLAHDLRNPLSAMNNALKLLEFEQCISERGLRALRLMSMQIQRVAQMVETMEDLASLRGGRLEIRAVKTDARPILLEIEKKVREILEVSRHRFESEIPDEAIHLEIDPDRLKQTVSGLVFNSMKTTSPGGLIRFGAVVDAGRLRIGVRDSGQGLTPEMMAGIFSPGVEAGSSAKSRRINLSLIKVLVERQGGSITVDSEGRGKGTSFEMEFPLDRQSLSEEKSSSGSRDGEAHRLRVLLTEDDTDTVELFTLLLQESGYEVRSAQDGASAFQICREFTPDVILLDIGLPDISGIELARRLRGLPRCTRSVFVALSGHSKDFVERQMKGGEFDYFITKSFRFENVFKLLDDLATRLSRSA